jgi:hypothetical protein
MLRALLMSENTIRIEIPCYLEMQNYEFGIKND